MTKNNLTVNNGFRFLTWIVVLIMSMATITSSVWALDGPPLIEDLTAEPAHPQLDQDVVISAIVTDASEIDSVALRCLGTNEHVGGDDSMDSVEGFYFGVISPNTMRAGNEVSVTCTVTAVDEHGQSASKVVTYTYDGEAPVAEFSCQPTSGEEGLEVTCTSESTDNLDNELDHEWTTPGADVLEDNGESVILFYNDDGEYTVSLQVTDDAGNSAESEEVIEVSPPPLEIIEDSIVVRVNGNVFRRSDEVTVFPGDTVEVDFDYQNNLNVILGYIDIFAFSGPEFSGIDDFVEHFTRDRALLPRLFGTASDDFEFTVPPETTDNFEVTIALADENAQGQPYDDFETIDFNLVRKPKNAYINSVQIVDDNLVCADEAELELDITNTGEHLLVPEIWVFDQRAVFNSETGEFDRQARLTPPDNPEDIGIELEPGERIVLRGTLDISDLNAPQTVYVYITSPFFWDAENGFFVVDSASTIIPAGNCQVSLRNPQPADRQVTVSKNQVKTFSIEITNPQLVQAADWILIDKNGEPADQEIQDLRYDFNAPAIYATPGAGAGTYGLKFFMQTNSGQIIEQRWDVTIVDRPTSRNFVITPLQNLDLQQLREVPNFFLENAQGRIQFTQPVDLSNTFDLDNVVKINQGLVAIDSANAPALKDKQATITMKGLNIQNPIIKTSAAFTATAAQVTDACNTCRLVSSGAQVVFEVAGFSTYTVSSSTPTQIEVPAKVEFPISDREVSVQTTFDIKNPGTTNSLTNVRITSNAVARYEVTFIPNTIAELGPGATATVQVSAKVPKDQDSGLVDIGDITVAANGLPSKTITAFFINAKSGLEVTDITVNGRTENKLQPGEENEFEAAVKNILGVEIEDITVKVIVKDIDEEDLDATSEEFDLNSGRNNEKGVTLLLPFNLDKETYTVEIEVTGTDINGADHLTKITRQIDVERRTHQLVLNKVDLPGSLSCNLNPVLTVEIKNIGKSDEEDVTLKVTSRTLNIQEERADLEIDKYSSSDNDKSLSFNLNLANAPTGTHLVNVDVYRDDELEDSKELSVTITPCSGVQQGGATTTTYTPPEEFLQQLQQAAQATAPETSVKSSFRESESYLILLAMLVFLTFFAVLLGAVTMMVKRKKK